MTPRQAQVARFVEAAEHDAAFDFAIATEFPLRGSLTRQQHAIAVKAIERFIAEVVKVKPWTGVGDLTPDELDAFRRAAIAGLSSADTAIGIQRAAA